MEIIRHRCPYCGVINTTEVNKKPDSPEFADLYHISRIEDLYLCLHCEKTYNWRHEIISVREWNNLLFKQLPGFICVGGCYIKIDQIEAIQNSGPISYSPSEAYEVAMNSGKIYQIYDRDYDNNGLSMKRSDLIDIVNEILREK